MKTKIRPLHDWAVIRQSGGEDRTAGGLYIPDAAKEKPQQGEVIAVGEGRYKYKDEDLPRGKKRDKNDEKIFVKTTLKPGDKVLYEKYAGSKVTVDNEEFVMVREDSVLGLIL